MQLSADFLIAWIREIDARVTALEKPPTNTSRLTVGHMIQIGFGLIVLGATLLGKVSWPEAFAILKSTVAK